MKLNLKKVLMLGSMLASSVLLTGCFGVIETGQVGVRTTWQGEVQKDEIQQGIYQHFVSSVKEFSVKEIPIALDELKPKASDNLRLQDFDVTVYYTVNHASVSELYIKYSSSTIRDSDLNLYYPAYILVKNLARSAVNDVVSKVPSMKINEQRTVLENEIKNILQNELDNSDKGVFSINRVNITNILTDQTVEDSIRKITQSENLKRTALNNLEVAKIKAEENKVLSQTTTPEILRLREITMLETLAKTGNSTFVIPYDFKGIIQVGEGKKVVRPVKNNQDLSDY